MSVLKSIKGTLQNVQQDISASFKSLRTKEQQIEKRKIISHHHGNDVMLDAGADLLNGFQQSWVEIHKSSEDNVHKAQTVDKKISYIYLSCEQQNDNLNQMLLEVSTLPPLLENITTIMQNIGSLQASFYEVEELLVELENVIEIQEMQQNKEHHQYKLAAYSQLKNVQIDHIKVKFAQEHAKKVEKIETENRAVLKQRHRALDQRIQEDMKNFQMFGKPPGSTSSESQVELSEIQPEEDVTELNEFLAIDEGNTEIEGASAGDEKDENTDTAVEVFEEEEEDSTAAAVVIKADEDFIEEVQTIDASQSQAYHAVTPSSEHKLSKSEDEASAKPEGEIKSDKTDTSDLPA